jgi:hypothetical protein
MPGEVGVSGEVYVPFEPTTDAQRSLRQELQQALSELRAGPGELLHATFAGPLPAGADVENALFYNLGGKGAFANCTSGGVTFERDLSSCDGVRYEHRLAPAEAWPVRWQLGSCLAMFAADLDAAPTKLAPIWWALRGSPGRISVCGVARQGREPFAMDLIVSGPARRLKPELIKTVLDGTICALQSERELAKAQLMAERVAMLLGRPVADMEAALTDERASVLGTRTPLVHTHGEHGVKWSPDDDMCLAARIVLERASRWRVAGGAHLLGLPA